MDPANPESFTHCIQLLSTGRKYHFVDQKPEGYNPATTISLLLIHGFPDTWYGWRYIIPNLVKAGYRVVAPEMLGYGQTDKPQPADEYTMKKLSNDLAALLDFLKIRKAVVIGHDWGAYAAGRFALWHPDRLIALAMLSVPFTARRPGSLEDVVKVVPNFGYQLYFADKAANEEIANNLELFLNIMYGAHGGSKRGEGSNFTAEGKLRQIIRGEKEFKNSRPSLLTPEETKYYMSQLRDMNGPLNYYRTTKARFDEEAAANLPTAPRADLPVLLIIGEADPTHNKPALENMRKLVPQTKLIVLKDVGHWVMVEAKDQVVSELVSWLATVTKEQSKL